MISNAYVLIPAAGLGKRYGRKKQFDKLESDYILDKTLKTFLSVDEIDKIVVSLPQEDLGDHPFLNHEKISYIEGGSSRADSVSRAYSFLQPDFQHRVLIHDGVRPLLSKDLIQKVLSSLYNNEVVIPALKLSDTIKEVEEEFVHKTHDRSKLRAVQTPQGFLSGVLSEIYEKLDFKSDHWTDESMLAEALGKKVKVIKGEKSNIKITTPIDLKWAKFLGEISS